MKKYAVLVLTLLLTCTSLSASAEDSPVTRVEFAAMLWQSAGASPVEFDAPFSDVSADTAPAVAWVYAEEVMRGIGGGRFAPDCAITREEAAVALRRYAARLGRNTFYPEGVAACNDDEDMTSWAGDALYWATGCGLLEWSPEGRKDPQGVFTPAQGAELLRRFLKEDYLVWTEEVR